MRVAERSIRWKRKPGAAGSAYRSKAVIFAAFCFGACKRSRAAVKVSAMRSFMIPGVAWPPCAV